jgi:hypothetical protein
MNENIFYCYECGRPLPIELVFWGDDGLEPYCEICIEKFEKLEDCEK